MKSKNKLLQFILLLVILSLFFRIDYRFKTTVECCSDDYDYFAHAETIALDRDFDYSNQITNDHPFYYLYSNKRAPVGFPGSGLLSAPFLLMGSLIDNTINTFGGKEILNYKLLLYSLAPIFYLFLGYVLLIKSLNLMNLNFSKYKLLIIYSGSGITYFAFERFSMTHAYEMFIISFLIWNTINFYKNYSNISGFLIPISLSLSFLVRMSNYFVFLIPLIVKKLLPDHSYNKSSLLKNIYFLSSSLVSFWFYTFFSRNIYGKVIFNPQDLYGTSISLNSVVNRTSSFLDFVLDVLNTFILILFGNEFGLLWVSPILFGGILLAIINLKQFKKLNTYLIILCFGQVFGLVYIWKSTAASYGFRYLYSLVPLSILLLYIETSKHKNSFYINLIFVLSIFSNIAILFFETTEQTQLSMVELYNSFGVLANYSEPKYVTGVVKSFFEINSYLIIFSTSFIGVLFFKFLLIFLNKTSLFEVLIKLGLPTENTDFINYIDNLEIISWNKVLLILLFLYLISSIVVFTIGTNFKNDNIQNIKFK